MRLFPKGKEWGRVFVELAVGIVLVEVVKNQLWEHQIEGYNLLIALVFGYAGGKMQDSALADGTLDKLTNTAVLILGAVPWGRRAYDRIVGGAKTDQPQEAVIVPRPDVPPPPHMTPTAKDD